MRKLNNNEAGFSLVEALLILMILVVIGFVSWFVYKDHHKPTNTSTKTKATTTASSTTKSVAPDPYSGWKLYTDSYFSFKYPSDWQAGLGQDKYSTHDVGVTSSGFTTSAISTVLNPNAPVTISLQLDTDDGPMSCDGYTCQVLAVVELSNPELPNSSFAVVNETSPNGTNFTQYAVVGTDTKVGDATITPAKFGNNGVYIYGQPYYTPASGGLTVAARVTDATALQANSAFKNLVNLVNSIKFD